MIIFKTLEELSEFKNKYPLAFKKCLIKQFDDKNNSGNGFSSNLELKIIDTAKNKNYFNKEEKLTPAHQTEIDTLLDLHSKSKTQTSRPHFQLILLIVAILFGVEDVFSEEERKEKINSIKDNRTIDEEIAKMDAKAEEEAKAKQSSNNPKL